MSTETLPGTTTHTVTEDIWDLDAQTIHTVTEDIWDPNTQSARPDCTITDIYQKGSDGFWYGTTTLPEGRTVEVYWSPIRQRWSGPVCQ